MATYTDRIARQINLDTLFRQIADQHGAVWLDSSLSTGVSGRYSFVARQPSITLRMTPDRVVLRNGSHTTELSSPALGWDMIERLTNANTKFAIGCIDYEATLPFLRLDSPSSNPEINFMFYDSVLRVDHVSGAIEATDPNSDDYSDLLQAASGINSPVEVVISDVQPAITKDDYLDRVRQIKWHIGEGDIYQANFTTRFDVGSRIAPFDAYCRLRQMNPGQYSAYVNLGDRQILSSSPERMFRRDGSHISTSPIKGTIERGVDAHEEQANLKQLIHSSKDRAELLMIVDLERNDLGRIATTGSVKVPELFRPEIYSTLIHLVSDVEAELKAGVSFREIIAAMLPGGSITGAPKKRAVEILSTIETVPRSIYTGCIGYLHGDQADFNIAIRTVEHRDGCYHVHAGGGIVADSDPEAEYDEMLLKASSMFRALGIEGLLCH